MKSGERVFDAPVMTSGALIHKVFPVESQTGRLPCCDVREGPSDRKLFFQHVRQLGISLGQHGQQLLKLQRGGGGDAQHKHTNYCLT